MTSSTLASDLAAVPASMRQRFVSGMMWSAVAAIAARSLGLVGTVVCARVLGQTVFGQFGIVLNTSNIIGSLAAAGLGITATRYVADLREREPERAGRIVALAWLTAFASGLLLTIVSLLTAHWLALQIFHAEALTGPLRAASLLVILNAMLAFQNGALAGLEAFRRLARINIISGVLSLPLILLGVWKFGLYGAVLGNVLWQSATWMLSERLLRTECRRAGLPLRLGGVRSEAGIFWKFSVPALLGAFSTLPVMWFCNVLIVRSRHGFDQMALYTAADRWRVAIMFLPNAVFQAALPMMANMHVNNPGGYRKVASANLWVSMGLVALPVFGITALSTRIMGSYGPGFRSGWPVLALFTVGTIPAALNTILGYPLVTHGRMWARFRYDLLLSLTLLGLSLWLIPLHGTLGYAEANLAAFTVTCLALWADLLWQRRRTSVPAHAEIAFLRAGSRKTEQKAV